jgi:gamma-glutamyltranspeptidase/glutathione hydrolase
VAAALEAIVAGGRDGFYGGAFGAGLLATGGGEYTEADLADADAEWVAPIGARVWGHDVWTVPPNSQGYLTVLGAAIAEGLDLPDDPADGGWVHLEVEAARAAGHDRPAVLWEHADVGPLLEPDEVARRRGLVRPDQRARLATAPMRGGTIYLCAVDRDRMGVSLIQSNAAGFGAHIVEPTTRIFLQNRGIGFSLEPGHPAEYGSRRRPPHTLSPALVTRPDGSLRMVIGTMGGDSQPQVLQQLLTRLLHHGERPGPAVSAPRAVLHNRGGRGFDAWDDPDAVAVEVEDHAPAAWGQGLSDRGHDVDVVRAGHGFGHAHVIEAGDVLAGAADPRAIIGDAAAH